MKALDHLAGSYVAIFMLMLLTTRFYAREG